MSINIPRRSDVRMIQPLLDVFQRLSIVVENACPAVTDITNIKNITNSTAGQAFVKAAGSVDDVSGNSIADSDGIVKPSDNNSEIRSAKDTETAEDRRKRQAKAQVQYLKRQMKSEGGRNGQGQ